jgi:SNF2 family DNA or RNA helicase
MHAHRKTAGAMRPHFRLTLLPHVEIIFKRMFPKVDQNARAHLDLVVTDESARDLEWFMMRFPLEAIADAEAKLAGAARRYDATVELIERLRAPEYVAPNVELALPARDYQLLPAEIVKTTGGLILGDEIGVGKTVAAIVLALKPDTLPMIVVTKTDLPLQIEKEFKRFAPGLRTHVITDAKSHAATVASKKKRTKQRGFGAAAKLAETIESGQPCPDVVIMSYSKLNGWAKFLEPHVRTVVYDEIQELRGGVKTQRGCAAELLSSRAKYRLGATATPIYNHGIEMHTVMDFIAPDALGSIEEFKRSWVGYKGRVNRPDALGTYLRERGLFLRLTRNDVGRELPAISISEQIVDHDPAAIAAIEGRAAELARFILAGGNGRGESMVAGGELDWRLRQATGLAKAPYVAAFVRLLVESGEKVLLYGWHHSVYQLWAEQLKDLKPAFYTGRETVVSREQGKNRFISGDTSVLVMSLRAGAGLDGLQYVPKARNVIFGELDWSSGVHRQCIGRLYRDGQSDPVSAYFMVCNDGADPIMSETLGLKEAQLRGILDPGDKNAVLVGNDEDRSRSLAEKYLTMLGLPIPQTSSCPAIPRDMLPFAEPADIWLAPLVGDERVRRIAI